jgi:hydroxylamine reductase (hybrid-cluster protein)
VLMWLRQVMDSWSHTLQSPCHFCKHSKRFVSKFCSSFITDRNFDDERFWGNAWQVLNLIRMCVRMF